jgi:chemotaxis protein MotB
MAVHKKKRSWAGGEHDDEGHGGSERWLVSYADFITLMFVVFLVLFSMAQLDNAKYAGLARSLRASMGPTVTALPAQGGGVGQTAPVAPQSEPGPGEPAPDWPVTLANSPSPIAADPTPEPAAPEEQPVAAPEPEPAPKPAPEPPPAPADPLGGLTDAFRSLPGVKSGLMSVALEERGLVISIVGSVLFEPGQTALRPEAAAYLNEVAAKLGGVEYPIMVQGMADDAVAPAGQGLSAWDLAALRAGSVVRYLVEQKGFPGSQFVTIGYGAGESGSDRRVSIVVMRRSGTP